MYQVIPPTITTPEFFYGPHHASIGFPYCGQVGGGSTGAAAQRLKGPPGVDILPETYLPITPHTTCNVWLFQKAMKRVKLRPAWVDILPTTHLSITPHTTCNVCLLVIPKGKVSAARGRHSTRNLPPYYATYNLQCLPFGYSKR